MPAAPVRQMTIPHLGFVGGLLYAIRKAGRQPPEPPGYLLCPITQVRASLRPSATPPRDIPETRPDVPAHPRFLA
jgi:hypothetical protein